MTKRAKPYPLPDDCKVDLLPGMHPGGYPHRLWVGWGRGQTLTGEWHQYRSDSVYGGSRWLVSDNQIVKIRDLLLDPGKRAALEKESQRWDWATAQQALVNQYGGSWESEPYQWTTRSVQAGLRTKFWQGAVWLSRYLIDWATGSEEGLVREGERWGRRGLISMTADWTHGWIRGLSVADRTHLAIKVMATASRYLMKPPPFKWWLDAGFLRKSIVGRGALEPLPADSAKPKGRINYSSVCQRLAHQWIHPGSRLVRELKKQNLGSPALCQGL